jgi:hypothetical protein
MGPETPLATGQPDLNTITRQVPVVPAPTNPVAQTPPMAPQNPFEVPAPTNFNIQGGGQFGAQVVSPEYGWQPSQADLGQQQVQQYGFAEGNVPVAQMGLAHGATAARQQALAERTQQNKLAQQKLIEKWDPMGGIGKAADPFQPAFAKATTKDFERLVSDWEQVFGDRGEAYKFLAGGMPGRELEGQQTTQAWSQNWDAIAQANRGYFKRAVDAVAGVDELKAYLSPEDQKVVRGFLTASTPEGLPVPGTDPQDYMLQGRRIEGILSKAQFVKDFMQDAQKIVQAQAQNFEVERLPGGNYALTEVSQRNMDEFVKFYADKYAEVAEPMGMKREEIEAEFRKLFNDEITKKTSTFKPTEDAQRASREAKENQISLSTNIRTLSYGQETLAVVPQRKGAPLPKVVVDKGVGQGVEDLYAPALSYDVKTNQPIIVGRSLTDKQIQEIKRQIESEGRGKGGGTERITDSEVQTYATTNNIGVDKVVPVGAGKNASAMESIFGSRDPYEVFAQQYNERTGEQISAEEVKQVLADPDARKGFLKQLK